MAIQDFLKNNADTLLQTGIGLIGGRTAAEQASMGLQGFQQGRKMNRTMQFLQDKNPELAQAVQAGTIDPADAFKLHMQQQQAAKLAQQPDRQWVELPDGSYGWADKRSGDVKLLGKASKPATPTSKQQDLIAAGLKPGTPEFQRALLGSDNPETSGFKTELDTMKTYRAEDDVKTYKDVRNAYERVRASAAQDNGQGDIGLIYGYMKMLDPGSVVREGEFATAENSAGIPTALQNMYNKAISGERLSPEQRQQFAQSAESLYNETAQNLDQTNNQYQSFATQYGVDPSRLLVKPEKYQPLKIGQPQAVNVGGKPATITKVGD